MGACNISHESDNEIQESQVAKSDFIQVHPIGKGGFGRVWKVKEKKTGNFYAMKEISKVKAYKCKSVKYIFNELLILRNLKNKFISNLSYAFQSQSSLYFITEYFPGGDLRYHINRRHSKRFSETETKFIICNILIALLYLRQNGIIHRDLKPENFLFDEDGYLHLTDFGISAALSTKRDVTDVSGTSGYMSPETLFHMSQSFQSDYFSLGVICYELIFGRRPFGGKKKKEMKSIILNKNINLSPIDLPKGNFERPEELCDFINKLLARKQSQRLGAESIEEIMNHSWLSNFNWDSLSRKEMESPFFINIDKENFDYEHANKIDDFEIGRDDYEEVLFNINKKKIFKNFYYCKNKKDTFVKFKKSRSDSAIFESSMEKPKENIFKRNSMKSTLKSTKNESGLENSKEE